jgi:hypothetical protein
MIRDRKMYVAPTPFALTQGTEGHITLILPIHYPDDNRLVNRGVLTRIECGELVVGYRFDLQTNQLSAEKITNPGADTKHKFVVYRPQREPGPPVILANS